MKKVGDNGKGKRIHSIDNIIEVRNFHLCVVLKLQNNKKKLNTTYRTSNTNNAVSQWCGKSREVQLKEENSIQKFRLNDI